MSVQQALIAQRTKKNPAASFAKIDNTVLDTPEGKGSDILQNVQNFDQGGDVALDDSAVPMPNSTADANNAAVANAVQALKPDKKAPNTSNGAPDTSKGLLNHFFGKQIPTDDRATPGMTPMSMGANNAAPAMPTMPMGDSSLTPSIMDQGGDVDMNDHVPAILQRGEYVIPKAKANQMRASQGFAKIMDEGGSVTSPEEQSLIPPTDEAPKFISEPKGKGTQSEAQPMRSDVPDQILPDQPKAQSGLTPAEDKALDVDTKKAIGGGDLVSLGKAALARQHLQRSTMPDEQPQTPASGYTPIAAPEAAPSAAGTSAQPQMIPTAPSMPTYGGPGKAPAQGELIPAKQVAPDTYKGQLADIDTKIRAALAAGDTDTADKLQYAKGRLQQATPWGSAANHPGILSKIGHIASSIGQGAAGILSPGLLTQIPGTRENMAARNAGGFARISQDTENNLKTAQTDAANAKETPKDEWAPMAGVSGPNGQPVLENKRTGEQKYGTLGTVKDEKDQKDAALNQQYLEAEQTKAKADASGDTKGSAAAQATMDQIQKAMSIVPKPTGQEANKLSFQATASKVAQSGGSLDPKNFGASLDKAVKNGTITKQEASDAQAYQLANPNAATNLTVKNEGADEALRRNVEHKDVLVDMPDGTQRQMNGAEAMDKGYTGFSPLTAAQAQKNRDGATTYQASTHSFTRYQNSLDNTAGTLTQKDRDGMAQLVEHAPDVGSLSGIVAELPGVGPVSAQVNKALQGLLTSKAYESMSPAAQQVVADYYSAVVSNFINMKQVMGSIGRNKDLLAAETRRIPLPYLPRATADTAFKDLMDDFHERNSNLPKIGNTGSQPQNAATAPAGATVEYKDAQGNVKGYSVNGKYVAAQ